MGPIVAPVRVCTLWVPSVPIAGPHVDPLEEGVAGGPLLGDRVPEGHPGTIVEPYEDALEDNDARSPDGRGAHGVPLEDMAPGGCSGYRLGWR